MTASNLSETDTGVYVDGAGDIVLVFTDTDLKKKSIILQEDAGKNFGRLAHMSDSYYVGDYAPYTPVRLFLPDIKRPDTPSYNIEEIERNEEHDGAWIGDQGTLIIHRSDGNPPDRTLHIMFYSDTHNELRLILCRFSPISVGVTKTEKFRPIMDDERLTIVPAAPNEASMPDHTPDTFHDKLDDIQKQIDEMKEQVSNALSIAQTAEATIDIIASRVSTLEEKTKTPSNARNTPDSEGFWRDIDDDVWHDIDDDIWACDHTGNVRLIARGHSLYDDDYASTTSHTTSARKDADHSPKSTTPSSKVKTMPIDERYYCDCGHIIYDDWNYCPECGRPTGNNTEWSDEDDYYSYDES